MVKTIIQSVVDWIETHLMEDITLEQCADVAGYSKFHLHRLFQLYMHQNLMEYVRNRRLAYAKRDISRGDKILDVAIRYGYGSERAFGRAFQKCFSVSPSSCRNVPFLIPPPVSVNELQSIGGMWMESYLSEVFYETLEDMTVVSQTVISNNPEEEVIESLNRCVDSNNLVRTGRAFGFDVPVGQQENVRGYEYWIAITNESSINFTGSNCEVKQIPKAKYVGLRITEPFQNPFERIPKGWGRLIEWLKDNNLEKEAFGSGHYCLEEVKEIDGVTVMDLFIGINH